MVTQQDIDFMIRDMDKRKSALDAQLKEFHQLQKEIRELQEKAPTQPEAVQKLNKLRRAFPDGFDDFSDEMTSRVENITNLLKGLDLQVKDSQRTNHQPSVENIIKMKKKPKKTHKYM